MMVNIRGDKSASQIRRERRRRRERREREEGRSPEKATQRPPEPKREYAITNLVDGTPDSDGDGDHISYDVHPYDHYDIETIVSQVVNGKLIREGDNTKWRKRRTVRARLQSSSGGGYKLKLYRATPMGSKNLDDDGLAKLASQIAEKYKANLHF